MSSQPFEKTDSPAALRANTAAAAELRMVVCACAGVLAGVLGLTNWAGLLVLVSGLSLTAGMVTVKAGGDVGRCVARERERWVAPLTGALDGTIHSFRLFICM